jgi:hypothetical protein
MHVDSRPDGSLLLTDERRTRWGVAAAGLGLGALLLAAIVTGETRPLETVVLLPIALIALLAGLAAGRHRDWILVDRGAREISHRRGLGALFRSVPAFPFDEVSAIVVETLGDGDQVVWLDRTEDSRWFVDRSGDARATDRLVEALHRVGRWPIRRERLDPGLPVPR